MHSAFRLPVSDVRRAQPASLAPELRTDAALRWLLLGQLDAIEDARADLSVEDDSERLHDLRVSLRRARTLVDASAGVFPEPVRTRFKRNLKGANELTGPVRDLDVLLAAFGRYRSRWPSEGRPYLELLRREVERERQPASRTVRAGLSSDGWRQWIGAWRTFLGSPVPRRSTLARAMQPVYEVATACIDRSLAKVTKMAQGEEVSFVANLYVATPAVLARYGIPAAGVDPSSDVVSSRSDLTGLQIFYPGDPTGGGQGSRGGNGGSASRRSW